LHGPGFGRTQGALIEDPGFEPGPQLSPQEWAQVDLRQKGLLIDPITTFFDVGV
jgi:hypothetical protein